MMYIYMCEQARRCTNDHMGVQSKIVYGKGEVYSHLLTLEQQGDSQIIGSKIHMDFQAVYGLQDERKQ